MMDGGKQDVDRARGEAVHDRRKFPFGHLPMTHIHPRFRHQFLQVCLHRVDRVDAVVDKEDLPAAFQFAQDRLSHQPRRIRSHVRDDRQSFLGRRVQVRDIAHPGQCHVERARDRCGGQRQDIHFRAEFFQVFLVRHAKALLLVDHHQPQILELHIG